jgi:hypothetical protein
MVFFEIIPVQTAPFADGAGFLRQLQIRDEVIPGAGIRDIHSLASFDWFLLGFYRSAFYLSNLSQRKTAPALLSKMQAQIPYFTVK